jgi:hypothetical protein
MGLIRFMAPEVKGILSDCTVRDFGFMVEGLLFYRVRGYLRFGTLGEWEKGLTFRFTVWCGVQGLNV